VLVWLSVWSEVQMICISLQTDNHASTSPLGFYRLDALPVLPPANSEEERIKPGHSLVAVMHLVLYCWLRALIGKR